MSKRYGTEPIPTFNSRSDRFPGIVAPLHTPGEI